MYTIMEQMEEIQKLADELVKESKELVELTSNNIKV